MSRLHKNIRSSALTQLLLVGARLLTSILLARALGPLLRGQVALAVWVPAIFNAVFYLGFGEGAAALMHRAGRPREQVVGCLNTLTLGSLILGSLVYVGGAGWILRLLNHQLPAGLYYLAFPLFAFTLVWAGWAFIHLSLGQVMLVNWGRVASQATVAAALLAGLPWLREHPGLAVMAFVLGSFMELLWVGSCLRAQMPLRCVWDPPLQRRQLTLGSQATMATWASILYQRLDLMLATWAGGAVGVGFYAVAAGMRDAALAVPETFGRPVISEATQTKEADGLRHIGGVFRLVGGLLALVAVCLGTAMPWLIRLLYSASFLPAVAIGQWLMAGFVAMGLSHLLTASLTGLGRMMPVVAGQLAGAVALCAGAAWLGPRHGVVGIAMALALSQWLSLAMLLLQIERRYRGSLRRLLVPEAAQ